MEEALSYMACTSFSRGMNAPGGTQEEDKGEEIVLFPREEEKSKRDVSVRILTFLRECKV